MRGYFAIGVERISKPMNLGNLLRTAHAFGASFFFTLQPTYETRAVKLSDTSDAAKHLPLYHYDNIDELKLPEKCALVGIELMSDSTDLPSFRHPQSAAYILGPERGSLSPQVVERCRHVVKIPTRFCVNVGTAGAIVMYDRLISLGRFARRPENPRAEAEPLPEHVHGPRLVRGD